MPAELNKTSPVRAPVIIVVFFAGWCLVFPPEFELRGRRHGLK